MLNHGASVNIADKSGATTVYAAVPRGYLEVVRELLNYDAILDLAGMDGYIPLHAADQEGYLEVSL